MKYFLAFIFFLVFVSSIAQDTISVQTYTYDSISTRRAIFDFPAELEGKQFEKVLMYYNIKCDPLTPWDSYNCGEWDYLAHSHIFQHTGVYDSVKVEGSKYLVNGKIVPTVSYTNTPYYHYFQHYEKFISYSSEVDTDFSIGSGALSSAKPFGSANATQRTQLLWKNSELLAAGLSAGEIAKLRFDLGIIGEPLGHLTVKMKHTSASEIKNFDETGWIIVYDRNTTFAGVGMNTLNLTTPFNFNGSSDILIDISFENGAVGALNNEVSAETSPFNSVVSTNERLGYLNIKEKQWAQIELSDFDFENEITISFWANGNADFLPLNTSVIEGVDSLNNRIANIHFPWSDSRHYWDAGTGSDYDRIDKLGVGTEISGGWHHWAFTKNGTTGKMNIYKDGALWVSGSDKKRAVGIINKFIIGANADGGNNWYGKLDEFRIWNKELTGAIISAWMNEKITPAHPNYTNLVAYYDFDETPSILDKSPNGRDAMMTSPAMVQFYEGSKAGFSVSAIRPNIVFVQGVYMSELDSVLITDSVRVNPIDVLEYAVEGRKFIIPSINHYAPQGYSYTFNYLGEKLDSVWHAGEVTLTNETIFYYKEPFEKVNKFEIGRFITPYGIGFDLGPKGFTYVYEVTDYQSLLKGKVDFEAHNTQELIDIKFLFVTGTPPRNVLSIERLWDDAKSYLYKDLDNDVVLSAKEVALSADGSTFKVRSRITGHGHHGAVNCCEWGAGKGRDHELLVNGVLRDTWQIWQKTACGDNPNSGQGGTWPYAREGWCPGDIVEEHEFDITPFVTPGTTATIDYDIEDVPMGDPDQGFGDYVISMHMVTYGEPNFNLDVAVVDVLNPNDWEYYKKWNPTCQNPRILIKNTGKTTLTSCMIDVWIGGFDNVMSYEWTGNLAFLEEEMVEIPITPGWWADFEGSKLFTAQVRLPNGGADEYANNNLYTVRFEASPVINEPFYIWFKTNNKAHENEIYLRDANGDIVYSRTTLANSTEYKDTLNLPMGCYTLELTDSDNDGISFWYSKAVEGETAGFLRLRKVDGTMIKTFDPDFGNYTKYSFSVGYAVGIHENEQKNYELSIYPNPSLGEFNLTLDNFSGDNIALTVYNELGATVHHEYLTDNNENAYFYKQLNLNFLTKGTYFLNVISTDKSVTKRIVIQ